MLRLHWQKITYLALFICASNISFSQNKLQYQLNYDAKKVRFGYFLGVTSTNYKIKYNRAYLSSVNPNTFYSITSPSTTGIKAGALVNVNLNDYFDFRFSPLSVSIYNREILVNDSLSYKQGDKAWFEIPMQFKYKSERRGNTRMFVFGGLKYGFETNVVNKKSSAGTKLTKTSDFSVEYGFGLEIFKEYFKVTPEIHFSHGLKNIVNPNTDYTNFYSFIDKMKTHNVTFYIVFQ